MIEERRSIRKFKEQSVSKEQIETIVEAARLAPSAKNRLNMCCCSWICR